MSVKNQILRMDVSRQSYLLAALAVLSMIIFVAFIIPMSKLMMPFVLPFYTMYITTIIFVESMTAYFLAIQFKATSQPYLGALSGAYGFVAVTATLQILVFPGVFTPHGLLGAGPQSSIWLWVLWHGGFPVLVLMSMILKIPGGVDGRAYRKMRISILLMLSGPILSLCVAFVIIRCSDKLPWLIQGGYYSLLTSSKIGPAIIGLNILALISCLATSKLKDLLSLWLAVAIAASLADSVLTLQASTRFSLGWYSGRLLSVIASSVVLCVLILEFSRLYQKLAESNLVLSHLVLHDGLTGVFNRNYFDEQLSREFKRVYRTPYPISLLMIDVDHFKKYNDTYGHPAGDMCLIEVASAIGSLLKRPADFLARYGGEEFVVVLPSTDQFYAMEIAESIRKKIKEMHLSALNIKLKPVTASIGLAVFDPMTDTYSPEEFLQHADVALYAAKASGRDNIQIYSESRLRAA
jgi:diguanylate cyclase (GGDEF)-like protein